MVKKLMVRYWDSDCFLGWFNEEPDKISCCQGVVQNAEEGKVKILTSALTLTEVIKIKNHPNLHKENEDKIKLFFQHEYIIIRNVDPFLAEYARELIWSHNHLRPYDSIHLATAVMNKAEVLDTFDDHLLRLDGKVGDPTLRITKPDMPYQPTLDEKD